MIKPSKLRKAVESENEMPVKLMPCGVKLDNGKKIELGKEITLGKALDLGKPIDLGKELEI